MIVLLAIFFLTLAHKRLVQRLVHLPRDAPKVCSGFGQIVRESVGQLQRLVVRALARYRSYGFSSGRQWSFV